MQLLRLIGGLGGRADGDLLARGEVLELLAQIALDGSLSGIGGQRGESHRGEAKRRHQDAKSHGGHCFFGSLLGDVRGHSASPHSTPRIKGHSTPLIKEMTPDAARHRASLLVQLAVPLIRRRGRRSARRPGESCPGWRPWSWPWRR